MIDKDSINKQIEEYINTGAMWEPINGNLDPYDSFLIHVAKRLINNYDLYSNNKRYYADFLSSLRNYLLTYDTSLSLPRLDNRDFHKYGLFIEPSTLRVSASFSFPNYIDNDFTRASFLSNFNYTNNSDNENNLSTDGYIQSLTGYKSFRSINQKLSVYGALNTPEGYTTLISIPTGGGKSLITQTVAYQSDGLTIVVVPTISLSIDQERVSKNTIRSANKEKEIFSYSSGIDPANIFQSIENKSARLLFISPEALILNSQFRDAIEKANKRKYLKNIIIDEAHIVTDWGALFRVDYQCLESWRDDLMVNNPNIRTFLLSATFEKKSTEILKDYFSTEGKWIEIRCDELRKEPRYVFVRASNFYDKKDKLINCVRFLPHPMIVYVARPIEAEDLKATLENEGFNNVKTFTGKTNNSKRKVLIDDWVDDKYDVMIATSAFGVGVDKSDVRTVVHAYMPQNANAYYQELGRGGRDKLPSLSVMCIQPKTDGDAAFQRVSKRVMTTEKICRRWIAMYNNPKSQRIGNLCFIDTSIKPQYRLTESDDEPDFYDASGDSDMNWNIYVILFLRRYQLIDIEAVRVDNGVYIFQISKINPILWTQYAEDSKLLDKISTYRKEEYDYYTNGLRELRESIRKRDEQCWSEMFFNTYQYVYEYCAGCGFHKKIIDYSSDSFALKKTINYPIINPSKLLIDKIPAQETVIVTKNTLGVIAELLNLGVNLMLSENSIVDIDPSGSVFKKTICHIINRKDLMELSQKKNEFYLSGVLLIQYPEDQMIMSYIKLIEKVKKSFRNLRIIHLLKEDVYIEESQKYYTDYLDAPVYTNVSFLE